MTLRQKQSIFAKKIALLIMFAYDQGYEITFGDAWAERVCKMENCSLSKHRRGSFHYKRLAVDLNLFKNGRFLLSTKAHEPLGLFWESIGGTWGGRFKRKDGNHYSWGE